MKSEVVVITGASAGVGRATVEAFAKRGACIGLLARGEDGLQGAKKDAERLGGKAMVLPTDVAKCEEVESAADAVEKAFGPIDVWINNAMASVFSPFKMIESEEFERVTQVTYLGTVFGTKAALRRMLPRNRGTIIQVGSALARRSIPLQSPYCGAKHAIEGFTDSIRSELFHDKSRVHLCMVQLPAVNTPQFDWVKSRLPGKPQPVPPIFQPEVIAEGIYWAAHHRRRELYIGGSTVAVIELNKLFPKWGDRYLGKTGFESQQTKEPADPNRPDNLWKPVSGDHGAHGRFDDRANKRSYQLLLSMHRNLISVGVLGIITVAGILSFRKRTKGDLGRKDTSQGKGGAREKTHVRKAS